jgi:hypothetical protein
VNYSIDGRLLKLELDGQYEPDDVIKSFVSAMGDPKVPDPVSLLVDVRRSETLATREVEQIRRIAEYIGPYAKRVGGRVAVVAASDIHFGLSRLGSVYAEGVGVETEVFRDFESAVAWLQAK